MLIKLSYHPKIPPVYVRKTAIPRNLINITIIFDELFNVSFIFAVL